MDLQRSTLLLVEDDANEVELARSACQRSGLPLDLVVVEDSAAALSWLTHVTETRRSLPHLILLDLKLPKLIGLAVLRRLRMDARTWDLPIIVYSRFHEPADVVLSYQVGANRFVGKPEDCAQFEALLHELSAYWLQPRQRRLNLAIR